MKTLKAFVGLMATIVTLAVANGHDDDKHGSKSAPTPAPSPPPAPTAPTSPVPVLVQEQAQYIPAGTTNNGSGGKAGVVRTLVISIVNASGQPLDSVVVEAAIYNISSSGGISLISQLGGNDPKPASSAKGSKGAKSDSTPKRAETLSLSAGEMRQFKLQGFLTGELTEGFKNFVGPGQSAPIDRNYNRYGYNRYGNNRGYVYNPYTRSYSTPRRQTDAPTPAAKNPANKSITPTERYKGYAVTVTVGGALVFQQNTATH